MRGHHIVFNGRHKGATVLVTVVEVGASLVVIFHNVREWKIAESILDELTRRREDSVLPRALFCRDVKAGSVVPSVMVSIVIDIPWVEWVCSPMIDGRDIVHSVGCIAIFPTVWNSITI